MKSNKGITLIALIITIVVLLILAVVAIGAAQDSNIVGYAQNAAGQYEEGKGLEDNAIAGYENLLSQYANGVVPGENGGGIYNPPVTPTPTPEITPEPTPTPVTYYSKTLNTNMNDYSAALAISINNNNDNLFYKAKITYVSGSSTINVELRSGTTFSDFSVIYVTYTDEQGSVSTYAICNPEDPWTLEEHKGTSGNYNYVPEGSWTNPSGERYTNKDGYSADIYEPITQIPVFEGEWQIDEANTTAEGKQYLSNVLIDVTN